MLLPRLVEGMTSFAAMVLCAGVACAQNYPSKPIRVVTAEPGGGNDFAARLIAPVLSGSLGQQVVVENRGGASGAIAAQAVAKAPPDGYTLLVYGSPLWLLPFLRDGVPYDPVKDFSPITWATNAPNILVVHPSLPVKSVKELISLAKERPGELNYPSSGAGGPSQIAAELFKSMAGVNIVNIPYKGSVAGLNDLLGGQVQVMFASAAAGAGLVKAGRLRALAVTSAQPSALLPGLPTIAASGLVGYESGSIIGMFAPTGTPAMLINRLNQEMVRALNQTYVKEKLFGAGIETVGSSPEEFSAKIKSEMTRLGKVIKDAGIRAD